MLHAGPSHSFRRARWDHCHSGGNRGSARWRFVVIGLVETAGVHQHHPGSPLDNGWIVTGLVLGVVGVAVAVANVVVLVVRRMGAERWRTHLAALTRKGQIMLERIISGIPVTLPEISDWYVEVRDDLIAHDQTGAMGVRFEQSPQTTILDEKEFLVVHCAVLTEFLREIRD